MSIFDRLFNRIKVTELQNVTAKAPKKLKNIEITAPERVRNSINDWNNALIVAEEEPCPDLSPLLEIYENIALDSHVSTLTQTRFNQIIQCDFNIISNDELDSDKTSLFKSKWFFDYVRLYLESYDYGFTGIQFGDIKDNEFTSIKSIPRFNIRPHLNGVSKEPYSLDHIDYSFEKEPLKKWCVLIDQPHLGLFNKAAKLFIYKREGFGFWGIYNELFGQPYRVLKTDINDNSRRKNAINAAENMGVAGFSIIHHDDDVDFINSAGGTGYKTHEDFINLLNKELSKLFLGQTMVFEDGSSRSQAEVHESQMGSFIGAYKTDLEFHINSVLIPKMIDLGFPLAKGDVFNFDNEQKLSKPDLVDLALKLSQAGYKIESEYLSNELGIGLTEEQLPTGTLENSNSIVDKVSDLYQGYFK